MEHRVIEDLEENFRNKRACQEHDPGTIVSYKVKIDSETFVFDKAEVTGSELLERAGLSVKTHRIYALEESVEPEVKEHEVVDLRKFGIEKFKTIKKGATEGTGNASPLTLLTEEDVSSLNKGYIWRETFASPGHCWLILDNYPIPDGYNVKEASIALQLISSYPTSQIDMAYFHPELSRLDGRAIGALSTQVIDGKTYQRWSRHRDAISAWRPGVDNVATHLKYVFNFLEEELSK